MDTILTVLHFLWILFLVIMVFNFMILVHEYGHFLAARWRGLVVDRFQIWFGKPLWKKEINGVQYGLGCIPAGGFVSLPQMVTMESIEGKVEDEVKETLPPVAPLDKIIVAFAGPLFSFLLAVVFAVIAWKAEYPFSQAQMTTTLGYVVPGSPAEKGGLRVGDTIRSIDGVEVDQFRGMGNSITWQIVSAPPGAVDIVIDRAGEEETLSVEIPKAEPKEVKGGFFAKLMAGIFQRPPLPKIGIAPKTTAIVFEVSKNSPGAYAGLKKGDRIDCVDGEKVDVHDFIFLDWKEGKKYKLEIERKGNTVELEMAPRMPEVVKIPDEEDRENFLKAPDLIGVNLDSRGEHWLDSDTPVKIITDGAKSIYNTLQKVFTPSSGISGGHLSGPAGIGGLLFDFFKQEDGWRTVIFFGALLNVNLAILNLLPFPVLDGGHIVMAIAEWIRRKPPSVRFLEVVQTAFVLLLFGFMIYVTFKDIGDRLPGKKAVIQWKPLA